jgi:hypothetical protein
VHDEQPRERLDEPQTGVEILHVLEVHERLVEQYVHVLGQRRQERAQLVCTHVVAGRVVRVADHDRARALADLVEQTAAVAGVWARVRVCRHQRI